MQHSSLLLTENSILLRIVLHYFLLCFNHVVVVIDSHRPVALPGGQKQELKPVNLQETSFLPSNSSLPHGRLSQERFRRPAGLLHWRRVFCWVCVNLCGERVGPQGRTVGHGFRPGVWPRTTARLTPCGVSILGPVCVVSCSMWKYAALWLTFSTTTT